MYGMIAASAGFFTYVMIMAQNGFFPSRLIGISRSWDAESVNDLVDSYGQEWTYDQRKALEYTCHSGFFISVVTVQIATLIVCKTRKTSLFRQGFGNSQLNYALIIELLLALFLTYTPSINTTTTMNVIYYFNFIFNHSCKTNITNVSFKSSLVDAEYGFFNFTIYL
jgi:sodium/potassium-transporting ATPase subunit alpha